MNKKILIGSGIGLAILCIVVCVSVIALVNYYPTAYQNLLENSSLQVGAEAPDFELLTITGETIKLSQFKGQSVILTISASWCPDCKREAPLLQKLHEDRPDIPIIMIDSKEDVSAITEFVEEYGITYIVALDPSGEVYSQYKVIAIPTLLFIDEQRVIKARIIESVTQESLDKLLSDMTN
jgi:peroxiredoxin